MVWIKLIFVSFLLGTVTCFYNECCPGLLLEEWKLCSDNKTKINLSCPGKAYMINNDTEQFQLRPEDGFLVLNSIQISPDHFCISELTRRRTSTQHTVAIVCFSTKGKIDDTDSVPRLLYVIMSLTSAFFMVVTLGIYSCLPELRDLQGKALMVFMCCLVVSYAELSFLQLAEGVYLSNLTCSINGYILFASFLSSFCWLNVICFNLWRTVIFYDTTFNETSLLRWYFGWGFGVPSLMIIVTLLATHIPGGHVKPNMGTVKCWFSGSKESWIYFYGPLSFLLLANIVMFLWTCLRLWRGFKGTSSARARSMSVRSWLYLRLFLIMGVTWVFEVVSFALNEVVTSWVWLMTDTLNCAQGIIIFLVLIVFRKRVRRYLALHRICGLKWPKHWARDKDEESDTILGEEEVEMSQTKC